MKHVRQIGEQVRRHLSFLSAAVMGLSLLSSIALLSPRMPSVGLDPSWMTVGNEATVRHLAFGRDIVNTLGPYAALFTRTYHPDLDWLILASSVLLAAVYFFLALIAFQGRRGLGYLLAAFFFGLASIDLNSVFFAFPTLFAIAIYRLVGANAAHNPQESILLTGSTLAAGIGNGMLCLSKVSMIPYSWVMMSICAGWLIVHRKPVAAVAVFFFYAASMVILWLISGQPISAFPSYLSSTADVISGYADAMSYRGAESEIYTYISIAAATLLILWIEHRDSLRDRFFIGLIVATCYFFSFKAGFVRHDGILLEGRTVFFFGHAATAALALLLIGVCTVALFRSGTRILICASIGLLGSALIIGNYGPANPWTAGKHILAVQVSAANGLWSRLKDEQGLETQYHQRVALIRNELAVPRITGAFDLYSYDQAYLLAHDLEWSPRPAFQSFSAYTPGLARINLAHLQGPDAAPNIIFKVQTIDGRYPSLDEGLSWPFLMHRYKPTMRLQGGGGGFLLLQRRLENPSPRANDPKFTSDRVIHLGTRIALNKPGPQYAKMRFQKTLAGKAFSAAYKAPMLFIRVELRGGQTLTYRLVSGMTETGFLLSPLVDDSEKFALVSVGHSEALRESEVIAFTLLTEKGGGWAWSNNVSLALSDPG